VAYGQQRSDDLRIPDAWWKGATEEEQEILRNMRTRIKARLQAHRKHPNGKPVLKLDRLIPKNKGAVQAQQALAYSLEDDIDDDDEDQAVAQLGHIEAETRNVFGGMARAYENEHVKCNFDYLDRIAQLSNSRASAYATADSGADTNVLGQEWLIIAMDPVRKINLVGFDAAHARKKGLSIVTADTIVMTADGQEIILRAHQSVSNKSTSTTLLSEIRMRHAGHVVDSVHKDHYLTVDAEKGTSLYISEKSTRQGIPFLQQAGLMTFPHGQPDQLDYQRNLPIVLLMLDHQWEPSHITTTMELWLFRRLKARSSHSISHNSPPATHPSYLLGTMRRHIRSNNHLGI
jgi:hypothetical protein